MTEQIHTIEVVYATAKKQVIVQLKVAKGTSARLAATLSMLDRHFPELELATAPLGIFGERVSDDQIVGDGDRVELYRELELDPKEARRRRAKQDGSN